jgi:MbtH protein
MPLAPCIDTKEVSMREQIVNGITFKIIINHREAGYFIWPAERENPPGWKDAGPVRASAKECLALIGALETERRDAETAATAEPRGNCYSRALGA